MTTVGKVSRLNCVRHPTKFLPSLEILPHKIKKSISNRFALRSLRPL